MQMSWPMQQGAHLYGMANVLVAMGKSAKASLPFNYAHTFTGDALVFPDDALEGTAEQMLSVVGKAKAEKWTEVGKLVGGDVGDETWAGPDAKALRAKELFEKTKHCMVVLPDKQGFASLPQRQLRNAAFFECLPESVDGEGHIGESPVDVKNINVLNGADGTVSFLFLSEYVALTTTIGNAAGRIPTAEGSDTLGAIERLIKVAVTCVAGEAMAAPLPLTGVPPATLTTDEPAQVADATGDGGKTNAGQKRRRDDSPAAGMQLLHVVGNVAGAGEGGAGAGSVVAVAALQDPSGRLVVKQWIYAAEKMKCRAWLMDQPYNYREYLCNAVAMDGFEKMPKFNCDVKPAASGGGFVVAEGCEGITISGSFRNRKNGRQGTHDLLTGIMI
jgi:hypothetical protein